MWDNIWKEWKSEILEENKSELEVVEAVEGPLHEITEQQVESALKGMKSFRAAVQKTETCYGG